MRYRVGARFYGMIATSVIYGYGLNISKAEERGDARKCFNIVLLGSICCREVGVNEERRTGTLAFTITEPHFIFMSPY